MFNVLRQKIAKSIFSRQIYQKYLSLDVFFSCFFVLSFFSGVTPLKGDIPNKYPLYKVYMGLIIKGPPSQGALPTIFPMILWGGGNPSHTEKSAGPASDFIPVARGEWRCGSLSNGL